MKRIIVLSDLHIGGDDVLDEFDLDDTLIEFLDRHQGSSLVLNGDFIDLWKIEKKEKIRPIIHKHKKLFERFRAFKDVTLLVGNHDHELAYTPEYRKELTRYGIKVVTKRFHKVENILFEHGNQYDFMNRYEKFGSKEVSLGEHFYRHIINNFIKVGSRSKADNWLKNIDSVIPRTLTPQWFVSRYYYKEMGGALKLVVVPILGLLGIAQLLFIPLFLNMIGIGMTWRLWVDTKIDLFVPKTIQSVFWFFITIDIIIILILIVMYLLKKDIKRTFKKYGFMGFEKVMKVQRGEYESQIINTLKEHDCDVFAFGHNHIPLIKKVLVTDRKAIVINTGSWTSHIVQIKSRFKLPAVYIPTYKLTYGVIEKLGSKTRVQLREAASEYSINLNLLEKFAIIGKKLPAPTKKDTLIKELTLDTGH